MSSSSTIPTNTLVPYLAKNEIVQRKQQEGKLQARLAELVVHGNGVYTGFAKDWSPEDIKILKLNEVYTTLTDVASQSVYLQDGVKERHTALLIMAAEFMSSYNDDVIKGFRTLPQFTSQVKIWAIGRAQNIGACAEMDVVHKDRSAYREELMKEVRKELKEEMKGNQEWTKKEMERLRGRLAQVEVAAFSSEGQEYVPED